MKVLKYFLLLFLGLILVFLGIGFANPSIHYGHEITVNKPLAEAWFVAQDKAKFSQWLEGFNSIELISGKQGDVGSRYKIIVTPKSGETPFEMIETIISKKELDHVSMHFDNEMMNFNQIISFSENNGKVNIKTASTITAKGIFIQSIFATMEMIGGAFQKQEAKNIEALKRVINENTSTY